MTVKNFLTLDDVIKSKGEEWREPLHYARTILPDKYVSDKNLIRLTKGGCTIAHLELMVRILFVDSKERPIGITGIDQFFSVVDRSQFNLSSWLNAITLFQQYLEEHNQKTPFPKMLGYLQCCEESPENKDIDLNFIDLVQDMLTLHGFIG